MSFWDFRESSYNCDHVKTRPRLLYNVQYTKIPVMRSRSRWSRNYLGPGAGVEIKFLINIFCSQFGGCYNEDKLISTSISIVLLF